MAGSSHASANAARRRAPNTPARRTNRSVRRASPNTAAPNSATAHSASRSTPTIPSPMPRSCLSFILSLSALSLLVEMWAKISLTHRQWLYLPRTGLPHRAHDALS